MIFMDNEADNGAFNSVYAALEEHRISQQIVSEAKSFYRDLAYHGFHHAVMVASKVLKLTRDSDSLFTSEQRRELLLAALYHDAAYNEDFFALGFRSSEELAAETAKRSLLGLGENIELAAQVSELILSTEAGAPLDSVSKKVLRAADLYSLGGPYNEFARLTKSLYLEYQGTGSDEKQSLLTWLCSSVKFLSEYSHEFIVLSDRAFNEEGVSRYHQVMSMNFERLCLELGGKFLFFDGDQSEIACLLEENDLIVFSGQSFADEQFRARGVLTFPSRARVQVTYSSKSL